jgi:group I intron endonuclease
MSNSGIYKIVNNITNKCYVGSAVNILKRFREHKRLLKAKQHHSKKLQHSFNKYNLDNFIFEIIEIVEDKNLLISREQFWIDNLNSFNNGYNCLPKAGSVLGFKASEETKRKHSLKMKGKQLRLGSKSTNEAKAKMSESAKKRGYSKNAIEAMRNANKGNKHSLGRKSSKETSAKRSASIKAHWEIRRQKGQTNSSSKGRCGNGRPLGSNNKINGESIKSLIEKFGEIDFKMKEN